MLLVSACKSICTFAATSAAVLLLPVLRWRVSVGQGSEELGSLMQ